MGVSRTVTQSPAGYDRQNLQAGQLFQRLFPRTSAEQTAGVTPSSFVPSLPWVDAVGRYGLVGDGVTDNTTRFEDMFSVGGQALFIRRGAYLTGKFAIPSGTTIYLEPGTELIDTSELGVNDRWCNISSEDGGAPIQNVHIIGWGALVTVDRSGYESGEQRHVIYIAGAVDNITVEGLTISGSGGDGVYIGGVGGGLQLTPDNVRVWGVTVDNARRNGVSITAGRSVTVADSIIAGTNGTSPQKGIDIEPDATAGNMNCDLYDINISGVRTVGNSGAGIGYINPYNLNGKRVTVNVRDCISIGDNSGFALESAKLNGDAVVTFSNLKSFEAETNGFDIANSGTRVLIDGCAVFNPNQSGQSEDRYGSSYSIYSVDGSPVPDGATHGNVTIRNSYAMGTTARKAVYVGLVGEDNSVMRDVDVEVWTDHAATKRAGFALAPDQVQGKIRVVFTDESEIATAASLGTSTMPAYLSDVITNTGASGAIALVLDSAVTRLKGMRVKVRVTAEFPIQLSAEAGWTIGGGSSLRSSTLGAYVEVEARPIAADGSSGKWVIVAGGEGWHRAPIALDNTGTPSVVNGTLFETSGTAAITAFDDGVEGQEITVLIKHDLTIDCTGTTLKGNGGADIAAKSGDILRAAKDSGGNWRLSFSDCTA